MVEDKGEGGGELWGVVGMNVRPKGVSKLGDGEKF